MLSPPTLRFRVDVYAYANGRDLAMNRCRRVIRLNPARG